MAAGLTEASKAFFFAKKKQKTFAPTLAAVCVQVLPAPAFAEPAQAAMQARGQKFFASFFKKEAFAFLV